MKTGVSTSSTAEKASSSLIEPVEMKRKYKQTELGRLPADWQVVKLVDCFSLSSGKTKPNNFSKTKVDENIFSVYGGNGITGFSSEFMEDGEKLIIGRVGEYCGCVHFVSGKYWITDNALYTKTNFKNNSILFLYYLLNYIELGKLRSKGGQPLVSQSVLYDILIPLPPLAEQKAIAEILSKWDEAIELTEKLIEAKKKRKKGLMQQLLTGKIRAVTTGVSTSSTAEKASSSLIELVEVKRKYKQTELGRLPEDWQVVKLGDVFTKVNRKNTKNCTRVLTASGQHGLIDQMNYFNKSVSGDDLSDYYLLKKGEYAYNRGRMNGYPYGAIKRLDIYEEGTVSTLYLCFSINDNESHSDYYRHFFEAGIINRSLITIISVGGRAHGLLNVGSNDFFEMPIFRPPLAEQKAIAEILSKADEEITLHEKELEAIKLQKKGLMQQLLTGKVRIKE